MPELLDAILVSPLDDFVAAPVSLIAIPGDDVKPTIWDDYRAIVARSEPSAQIEFVERFASTAPGHLSCWPP